MRTRQPRLLGPFCSTIGRGIAFVGAPNIQVPAWIAVVIVARELAITGLRLVAAAKNVVLPMMYMPDCLKATIELMEADVSRIKRHDSYNVAGMSFSAGELAAEIKKYISEFKCNYKPDFRQEIADSWPMSIDDSVARKDGPAPDHGAGRVVHAKVEAGPENLRLFHGDEFLSSNPTTHLP
jgi:hypothetical protein